MYIVKLVLTWLEISIVGCLKNMVELNLRNYQKECDEIFKTLNVQCLLRRREVERQRVQNVLNNFDQLSGELFHLFSILLLIILKGIIRKNTYSSQLGKSLKEEVTFNRRNLTSFNSSNLHLHYICNLAYDLEFLFIHDYFH